jgi:hypothetical protein
MDQRVQGQTRPSKAGFQPEDVKAMFALGYEFLFGMPSWRPVFARG